VKSGDRGLASLARQSSIPCSGSFTEAHRVYSEGRTGLGEALLAGLRWRVFGWPRARRARVTPVIWCSGEVKRAWGNTVKVPGGFIGVGAGNDTGSAWRDAGHAGAGVGRALASSERVEHVALCFCSSSTPC
jgi:hypothetical protein